MATTRALLGVAGAAALLAACAPTTNVKVSEAEAAYSVAQADPVVSKDGQLQLYEAKQDLDRAHHALKNGDDTEIVEHYAYLAQRRVEIARANADREEARKRSQALGAERDAAVLDERTREADRAHESAALANERAASPSSTRSRSVPSCPTCRRATRPAAW